MRFNNKLKNLLNAHCFTLIYHFRKNKKYPAPTDSFQEASDIELGLPVEEYNCSGLWGYFLLWIYVLDEKELYNKIESFLNEDLKNVTKCVWFLRSEDEILFYNHQAMNITGEGYAIEVKKKYEDFYEKIKFVLEQYENERFSFEDYCAETIEIITCSYYGYVPRVQILVI